MDTNLSRVFRTVEQREKVVLGLASSRYVKAVSFLPDVNSVPVGTVYLLTKFCRDYVPGIIYILNEIDGVKQWMDITIGQIGKLQPVSDFWKRITKDSIILHWKSPEDYVDPDDPWKNATWDYEVIVRKFGKDPESPEDGEILGYSTIRDQYYPENGGFEVMLGDDDPDFDYHYAVFACTISNQYTRSAVLKDSWTWPEIQEQLDKGTYHRAFRVGDVIPMPRHTQLGVLHAVIVDFDRKPPTSGEQLASIVFQTKEVIGNMSFDNKELMYARTSDVNFMRNKRYFLRSVTGTMVEIAIDPSFRPGSTNPVVGSSILDYRSKNLSLTWVSDEVTDTYGRVEGYPVVYVEHPTWSLWVNSPSTAHDSLGALERAAQSGPMCGDSNWHFSNIHDWLNSRLGKPASQYLEYHEKEDKSCMCGPGTGCTADCTCIHSLKYWWELPREQIIELGGKPGVSTKVGPEIDPNVYWMHENFASDEDWCTEINGWFKAVNDDWHNIAPGSLGSARYIDKLPFCDGFPMEFLSLIYRHYTTTITDEIYWRYVWGGNERTTPTYDAFYKQYTRPALAQFADIFWLPSYEEVFGTRPVYGINGMIKTEGLENVSEGEQFAFFKNNDRSALVKKTIKGEAMAWYLRSCDPTTVGRIYYIEDYLEDHDDTIEHTCTAHREVGDNLKKIGPAPCFMMRAK